MDWSLVVSIVALVVAAATFGYQIKSNRRKLLLQVHQEFVSHDRQRGRRIIFKLNDEKSHASSLSDDDHDAANASLSQLNTIGYLYSHGHIPKKDTKELISLTASRTLLAAKATGFIEHRNAQQGIPVWPYLQKLADAAGT
jgi:hypothetical protein